MDAQHRRALLNACEQLIQVRRLDLAGRELGRWLSLHPEDAHGHALLGWTRAPQGRGDEAVGSAGEAVRLEPDWAYTHGTLARVLEELDRHEESERSVREALKLEPHHAFYHALLGASLLNQRPSRTAEALDAADAGLAVDPRSRPCARVRAQGLLRLGRLREAREAADFALHLSPESSELHEVAGWIELSAGNLEETREHLREALRMDPMNDSAAFGLRLAGDWARFCAALTVQAERWALSLALAVVLFAAEVVALTGLGRMDDVLPGCALVAVAALGSAMLWVRRRHPDVLAEMRVPGSLTPAEQRDALWALALLAGILLLLPLARLV